MTNKQLQQIRERAAKATQAPWRAEDGIGLYGIMARRQDRPQDEIILAGVDYRPNGEADASFIAYAREDVPALLAEVERVKEQRDYFRDAAKKEHDRAYVLGMQNAAMRKLVQDVAEYPEYQNEDGWLAVLRAQARQLLNEGATLHNL